MELYHITLAYASALLAAILPQVSEVAERLDLPIECPIAMEQVQKFVPNPFGELEGGIFLTDHSWFHFDRRGFVDSFTAPTNWFTLQELETIPSCYGKSTMSTNEMIEFALDTVSRLGYTVSITNQLPEIEGPFDLKDGNHVPYCRVKWVAKHENGTSSLPEVRVEINTQDKKLVGFDFNTIYSDQCSFGNPVKMDIEADSRTYFLQRIQGPSTNAPNSKTENNVKMTPAYSDALLKLILPRVSGYAQKLDIIFDNPLTTSDVKTFNPNLEKGKNGGRVELKNGYSFVFDSAGFVSSFTAPGWFSDFDTPDLNPVPYLGKVTMNTNEIISLARQVLLRSGYPPSMTHSGEEPNLDWAYFENGTNEYSEGALPYCILHWSEDSVNYAIVGINAKDKRVEWIQFNPASLDGASEGEIKFGTPLKMEIQLDPLFVHLTPDYSNALLKLMLPRISDFTDKLGLPVEYPIDKNQILQFRPSHIHGEVAGCVELKDHSWFEFDKAGYVNSFRLPNDYFFVEPDYKLYHSWSPEKMQAQSLFFGKISMTTNEMVTMAREAVHKLGYDTKKLGMDKTPKLQGPYTLYNGEHIPCCRVVWESEEATALDQSNTVHVEMTTQDRKVVGLYLHLSRENRESFVTPIKIGIAPEGLPDFLKRKRIEYNPPKR